MSNPTRFTSGVSTRPSTTFGGTYPLPDPVNTSGSTSTSIVSYWNDFYDLGASVARSITGGATFALADALGGVGVLTPAGATTACAVHRTAAAFQFVSGNKLWCLHRIKASALVGNQVLSFGLSKASGGTIATTDRLYFNKAAGSTSLNLISVVNNVSTTLLTGVATCADDTYLEVAYYYDGTDLLVYVDDVLKARVTAPTIGASSKTITNAVMSPFFGITPAATETVSIDYALIAQEVTR